MQKVSNNLIKALLSLVKGRCFYLQKQTTKHQHRVPDQGQTCSRKEKAGNGQSTLAGKFHFWNLLLQKINPWYISGMQMLNTCGHVQCAGFMAKDRKVTSACQIDISAPKPHWTARFILWPSALRHTDMNYRIYIPGCREEDRKVW